MLLTGTGRLAPGGRSPWAIQVVDGRIAWGNDESDNIVWGIDGWISWGHEDGVSWGNSRDDNLVWGNGRLRDIWASNVVPGFWDNGLAWNSITRDTMERIVWGER